MNKHGILGGNDEAKSTLQNFVKTFGGYVILSLVLAPTYSYLDCWRSCGLWCFFTCLHPKTFNLAPGIFVIAISGGAVVIGLSFVISKYITDHKSRVTVYT